MAFCTNCACKLGDNVNFCATCGAKVEKSDDSNNTAEEFSNTPYTNIEHNDADTDQNRVMGIFCYLSWLVLIPIFTVKNSEFVRFHANQGLALVIASTVWNIIYYILKMALSFIFSDILSMMLAQLLNLPSILFAVLIVIGIINVVKGETKELPIIGNIKILK